MTPKPVCSRCKDVIGPFLVKDDHWVCNICAYKEEYPNAELVDPVRRRGRKQRETLFDPTCYS